MNQEKITIIKPSPKISFPNLKEIWEFRELLFTFVIRDLKVRYRQTVMGGLWAIIQPFSTMIIFSFFFGRIAKIPSEGIPYPVFSYSGLVLWTYFSNSLSAGYGSVLGSAGLFTKVYFPRIIIPIAAAMTGIVDYCVALTIVFGLMAYYHISPSINIFFLPLVVILTLLLVIGLSFWIGAINVKYRDVRYIMPFFISLMLYMTPVIYPVSVAPNFRNILHLNPMTGIIEAHRSLILGNPPINYTSLLISIISSLVILITGAIFFRSVERKFADVV
jgi:lipopolysaccharide transport system permease protein